MPMRCHAGQCSDCMILKTSGKSNASLFCSSPVVHAPLAIGMARKVS